MNIIKYNLYFYKINIRIYIFLLFIISRSKIEIYYADLNLFDLSLG